MNAERGYATPEEAALAGFDPRFARVVVTLYVSDDLAEVELETNTPDAPYPYFSPAGPMDRTDLTLGSNSER